MNAPDVLCAQLMRDLFAIAKLLFDLVIGKTGHLQSWDYGIDRCGWDPRIAIPNCTSSACGSIIYQLLLPRDEYA